MYPMTVTIHNEHQLSAILAALQPPALGALGSDQIEKSSETKKAKATVATNGASSTPAAPSPLAAAVAQQPAPAEPAAASVSYEQVKVAIQKLAGAKGRDAVLTLLGEFGATNGPSLKPEQYADFVAKASA